MLCAAPLFLVELGASTVASNVAQPPVTGNPVLDRWMFLLWKRAITDASLVAELTDGSDTNLHYHSSDRDLANATGQLKLNNAASLQAFAAAHG